MSKFVKTIVHENEGCVPFNARVGKHFPVNLFQGDPNNMPVELRPQLCRPTPKRKKPKNRPKGYFHENTKMSLHDMEPGDFVEVNMGLYPTATVDEVIARFNLRVRQANRQVQYHKNRGRIDKSFTLQYQVILNNESDPSTFDFLAHRVDGTCLDLSKFKPIQNKPSKMV